MKVGITGHQNLGEKDIINWLTNEITIELKKITPVLGYSSLAKGADQLFAELILQNEIDLIAIIPSENYETTFKDDRSKKDYKTLINRSIQAVTLSFDEPSQEAFFEAGKQIVQKSDILFAVWNAKPSKGLGGTGDVVNFAIKLNKKIVHFNPISKQIKYLNYGY